MKIQACFINIFTSDVEKSRDFYKDLGFKFSEKFSDEESSAFEISPEIFLMVLSKDKFAEFTPKDLAYTERMTETINSLKVASRKEVNEFVEKAISLGAKEFRDPQEYDHMFVRAFYDLDGHIWEIFYMEMK